MPPVPCVAIVTLLRAAGEWAILHLLFMCHVVQVSLEALSGVNTEVLP